MNNRPRWRWKRVGPQALAFNPSDISSDIESVATLQSEIDSLDTADKWEQFISDEEEEISSWALYLVLGATLLLSLALPYRAYRWQLDGALAGYNAFVNSPLTLKDGLTLTNLVAAQMPLEILEA